MAPLDPPGAGATAPNVHLEQRRHRPGLGQLGLPLLGDALQFGRPAAAGAHHRRRDFEDAVRLDRGHAMAGAMRWPWRPWPLPFLRPGRAGLSEGSPLENGADWRLPARRASSSSRWSSAIRLSRAASDSRNSATDAASSS